MERFRAPRKPLLSKVTSALALTAALALSQPQDAFATVPSDPTDTTTTSTWPVYGDVVCLDGNLYPVGSEPADCNVEPTTTTEVVETGLPPGAVLCLDGIMYADFNLPDNCYGEPTTVAQTTESSSFVPSFDEGLPNTGKDTENSIILGSTLLALGAGLVLAARRPR